MFFQVTRFPRALLLLILAKSFILFLVGSAIYYNFLSDPTVDHSFTQSETRQEFYPLLAWNSTNSIIADIDRDAVPDLITQDLCIFLSSVSQSQIPVASQCAQPSVSKTVFPNRETVIGQQVTPRVSFRFDWLRYSFLVKDWNETWFLYDMNGFELRKYELTSSLLFVEVEPTQLDRIDIFTYQITHLGVALSIVGTYLAKHFHFIATK